MRKSIYSPCVKCDARVGHYCCGCPNEREWTEWKNSLSDEEWNKLVDETREKYRQRVKKTLENAESKFNKLKR
jgi:predicted Fe-S protein YdhL (DUF1289 family)